VSDGIGMPDTEEVTGSNPVRPTRSAAGPGDRGLSWDAVTDAGELSGW
jgi:hypothetical protein